MPEPRTSTLGTPPQRLDEIPGARSITTFCGSGQRASVAEAPDPDLVLSPDDEAEEAIRRLSTEGEALPVVVEDGQLVGVVSHRDLYRRIQLRMGLRGGPDGSDNL